MITLKQLELKAEAVAKEIGVEARHILTVLHNDIDKLFHSSKVNVEVKNAVLHDYAVAKTAIETGVNEVHAEATDVIANVEAEATKVEAVVTTVEDVAQADVANVEAIVEGL